MTRIAILDRDDMTEEQRSLFDELKAKGGRTTGPYWAYIRNPAFMRLNHDTSDVLRAGRLTGRERQIAVLTVIREWSAAYPWAVQVRASLAAGVDQPVIDAIDQRRDPGLTDPAERVIHKMAQELAGGHSLSEATYAEADEVLGADKLVDAVCMIGFFAMVSCTANAFDITPPDDAPARLA